MGYRNGVRLGEARTERGVTERSFELTVGGERVPGILWTPAGARGPRPLVLQGHGGTQHKRVANILSLARRMVRSHGYASAAIDAPNHGDRAADRQADGAQRSGPLQLSDARRRGLMERSGQAVAEWRATLDALRELDEVGAAPVGYWGLSMGTLYGVPLLAEEPRIGCAVLGLAGLVRGDTAFAQAARRITVPLLYVVQRDDELMTPEQGLSLFDAFGSSIKSMHVNPGPHLATPRHEREYYETFFARHLGAVAHAADAEAVRP